MNRQYFGTDGVRGPYGGPIVNEAFAARLGYAVASWLPQKGRALIGRDTRASGPALEEAVARGLAAAGVQPVSLGVLPTPAVARAVKTEQAVLGVVITASHNPPEDNGIKFFGGGGIKFIDQQEAQIEQRLPADEAAASWPQPTIGELANAAADYIAVAGRLLPAGALKGFRIVLDTAHGATCSTSPVVLRGLGAQVLDVGASPNGHNINVRVGSENPLQLLSRVRAESARIGIAHDGDGDRCVLCDERGEVLDGDEILTLLATHALARGKLAEKTLVITVQSNLGVDAAVTQAGGRVLRTSVGDRYVIERMRATGATLGGESSGHIVCSDISPTGDGLIAALKVIEVMLETGKPLSQLRHVLRKFPQKSVALPVREKKPLEALPRLTAVIRALETELGAQGRVLVRYSGTEAKLRLLIEGPADRVVAAAMVRLESAARSELDVLPEPPPPPGGRPPVR